MTFGSLFSGVGGLDLGLEWAGFEPVWQIEVDDWRRERLKELFPEVAHYKDIKDVKKPDKVDVLAGGFPCQPTSQAAARSERGEGWLWPQFHRLINEVRPAYAIIENPEALRYKNRGLGTVLRDLAESGYDATWQVLRASYFGAPHKRARIWVVANAHSYSQPDLSFHDETPLMQELGVSNWEWPNPPGNLEMVDGVSRRLALKAYGNAVVPYMAWWVGNRIMDVV